MHVRRGRHNVFHNDRNPFETLLFEIGYQYGMAVGNDQERCAVIYGEKKKKRNQTRWYIDNDETNDKIIAVSKTFGLELTQSFASMFIGFQKITRSTRTEITSFDVRTVLRAKTRRVAFVQVHTFVRSVQNFTLRARTQRSLKKNVSVFFFFLINFYILSLKTLTRGGRLNVSVSCAI